MQTLGISAIDDYPTTKYALQMNTQCNITLVTAVIEVIDIVAGAPIANNVSHQSWVMSFSSALMLLSR